MKIFNFKALTSVIVIATIFSSCLSDSDNSIRSSQDIAFITSKDYTICAATSSGYITSPDIQDLKLNECYIIGYKLSTSPVDGVYTADYINKVSKGPLPQTKLLESAIPEDFGNELAVTHIDVPLIVPSDYMGDRWLFYYSTSAKESKKTTAHFFYDKDNQIDKDDKDISKDNKMIIDVRFTKSDTEEGNAEAQESNYFSAIGNLESLRRTYTPDYTNAKPGQDGEEYVPVLIQFRYQKNTEKDPEVSYLGSWDTMNYKVYYMTFTRKK